MLHRHLQTLGLVCGLLAALGACRPEQALDGMLEGTVSGTHDYGRLMVPLTPVAAQSVAVAVIDRRPYVVEGDEPPDFVGTIAGRFRNTIDVKTESGLPLAEVVADAVVEAYRRQGIDATAVPVAKGAAEAEALAALAATGAERLVLLSIGEWQTNAVVRVEESWQFLATVHDRAGAALGRRASQGRATLGTVGFDEAGGEMAAAALSQRLAYLLNDPEITRALGATPGGA